MPPLAPQLPECSFRLGIDLNPVDLTDPIARRWFDALIWPEHAGRRRLAAAAVDELLREPPVIVKGDAVDLLDAQLEQVPSDATLIVYNSRRAVSVRARHRSGNREDPDGLFFAQTHSLAALRKRGSASARNRSRRA